MNILELVRKLDKTPLQREVRGGKSYNDLITFYNESNEAYDLIIDHVEYNDVLQACIILKEDIFYLYIQHGENPNFVKLDINQINEIDLI